MTQMPVDRGRAERGCLTREEEIYGRIEGPMRRSTKGKRSQVTKCPNHEENNIKSKVKSAVTAGNRTS
jgi:hypothetical protein